MYGMILIESEKIENSFKKIFMPFKLKKFIDLSFKILNQNFLYFININIQKKKIININLKFSFI